MRSFVCIESGTTTAQPVSCANEAREFPNRRRDAGAAMRKHQSRIAVAEAFFAGCRRRRFNHVLGILLMRQYQKCVIPHRLQRRFIVLANASFDLSGQFDSHISPPMKKRPTDAVDPKQIRTLRKL